MLLRAIEHGELVPARVHWVLLPDLNRVIGQEVENQKRPALEEGCLRVLHDSKEPTHLSVILYELLLAFVDVASATHNFIEVPVETLRDARLRLCLPTLCELETALLWLLWLRLLQSLRLVEVVRELITVIETYSSAVDVKVLAHTKVERREVASVGAWEPVPADQGA
eukprot:CAMPEP_0194490206 /NCGR_PEP_ID=MMETSP0253-20130528/9501_1 /TAXON_ID=2966 /ORGANISM="Noctiluca scintillans" /LENGTH=167 /DNA_ID=CAMNT_0039330805 /DNA_START=115 /DNA_END=615 /DNA_ORIENTATION=-